MSDHAAVVRFFRTQLNRIADSDLSSRFLGSFLVTSFSVMPQLSGHAALTFGKLSSFKNARVNSSVRPETDAVPALWQQSWKIPFSYGNVFCMPYISALPRWENSFSPSLHSDEVHG